MIVNTPFSNYAQTKLVDQNNTTICQRIFKHLNYQLSKVELKMNVRFRDIIKDSLRCYIAINYRLREGNCYTIYGLQIQSIV